MADHAVIIGATDANYNIGRSRLLNPHEGCVLEKVSVSGGKVITAGFTFGIGCKDRPVHVSRNGYVPKLQWKSKKYVVLWDEEDKRGWLVNGTSALLHLLRTSLEVNSSDKFKSAFLFKREEMRETPEPYTANSAIEILLNPLNKGLKLYPDKEGYLRLEDRVENLYNILEKIIEHHNDAAAQGGVNVNLRARKHLEGWDFMDLATDQDPLYPRVATIQAIGNGWVDLTRDIHAITLSGRGFGEITQPTVTSNLCPHWDKLPHWKYYLAACVSDLNGIMDIYGDQRGNPMRLSNNIFLHDPDKIFESCQCKGNIHKKHSDYVQVPRTSKSRKMLSKECLIRWEDCGAVVLDHSLKLTWLLPDIADPKKQVSLSSSHSSGTQFHDSGIESSQTSSVVENGGDLACPSSQQRSSENSFGEPLPVPIVSEDTRPDKGELQNASIQGQENYGSADTQQGRRRKHPEMRLRKLCRKLTRHG